MSTEVISILFTDDYETRDMTVEDLVIGDAFVSYKRPDSPGYRTFWSVGSILRIKVQEDES